MSTPPRRGIYGAPPILQTGGAPVFPEEDQRNTTTVTRRLTDREMLERLFLMMSKLQQDVELLRQEAYGIERLLGVRRDRK